MRRRPVTAPAGTRVGLTSRGVSNGVLGTSHAYHLAGPTNGTRDNGKRSTEDRVRARPYRTVRAAGGIISEPGDPPAGPKFKAKFSWCHHRQKTVPMRGPRRRDPSSPSARAPPPALIYVTPRSVFLLFDTSRCPRVPSPLTFRKIRGARIGGPPLFYFGGSISLLPATPSSILVVLGGNFTVAD
ncbi:hypothetical protein B296_00020517 [Ensete ventricosum]|uniref:Uncharacterized protein n=1 Tax=Ensete ventricosum TaxID=4639 RepID=A0A426YJF0_ENSVE|nr:hypothetical protein B296_00020517 [Ensete ventricosum]